MKNIYFYLIAVFVSLTYIACKRSDTNLNTNSLVSISIQDIAFNEDNTLMASNKNIQEAKDSVYITQTRINDTLIAETHLVKEANLKNNFNGINKLAADSIPNARISIYAVYIYDKDDKLLQPPVTYRPAVDNKLTLTLGETYTFVVIAQRINNVTPGVVPTVQTPEHLSTAKIAPNEKGVLYFKKKLTLSSTETPLNVIFKPYFSSAMGNVYLDQSIAGYISVLRTVDITNPNQPVGVNFSDNSAFYGTTLANPNDLSVLQNNTSSEPRRTVQIYNYLTASGNNTIITGPETTSGKFLVKGMTLCTHYTANPAYTGPGTNPYIRYNETTIPDFEIQNLHFQPGYFYTMSIYIKASPIGAGANNNVVTEEWTTVAPKTIPLTGN